MATAALSLAKVHHMPGQHADRARLVRTNSVQDGIIWCFPPNNAEAASRTTVSTHLLDAINNLMPIRNSLNSIDGVEAFQDPNTAYWMPEEWMSEESRTPQYDLLIESFVRVDQEFKEFEFEGKERFRGSAQRGGTSAPRHKANPWQRHVKRYRSLHPNVPASEVFSRASQTYRGKSTPVSSFPRVTA